MSDPMYDIGEISEPPSGKSPFLRRWCIRFFMICIMLTIVLVGTGAFGSFVLYDHITQPRIGSDEVMFNVPQGATGNDVGILLAESGLIEHELFFRIAIHLSRSNTSIKHGDFILQKGKSPVQLLEILRTSVPQSVDEQNVKVTIPEGLTLAQIAALRNEPEAFLLAVESLDLWEQFGIAPISAEGFLMPNTYFFNEEPSEQELVKRMVDQFNKDFDSLLEQYPEMKAEDKISILTVASLVEEEARLDEERPIVAAVVYNRLSRKMPLEMDSTLQYILGKYGQRLLNEDKEADSPYNTYMNRGLPPGPISNPGAKSIEAAMNPADVDYIFFVSNADGKSHTFTSNLRDHDKAVAKYRREIKVQRREEANR
jgi:UPF0755 protein